MQFCGTWQSAAAPPHCRCCPSFPHLAPPSSTPADFGFDPLSLGKDEAALKWYTQAELQNGRWAMLGVAGILVQVWCRRRRRAWRAVVAVAVPMPCPCSCEMPPAVGLPTL